MKCIREKFIITDSEGTIVVNLDRINYIIVNGKICIPKFVIEGNRLMVELHECQDLE